MTENTSDSLHSLVYDSFKEIVSDSSVACVKFLKEEQGCPPLVAAFLGAEVFLALLSNGLDLHELEGSEKVEEMYYQLQSLQRETLGAMLTQYMEFRENDLGEC